MLEQLPYDLAYFVDLITLYTLCKLFVDMAKLAKLMDAETWMDGQAAVDAGFADALIDIETPARAFALDAYARVPAQIKRRNERALHEAGLSRSQARRGVPEPEPTREHDDDLVGALEALAERLGA